MLEFSQKSRHLISKAVCFISRSCGDVHIPVRYQEVCMRVKTVPSMTVCIEWAMSSALRDRDITEGLASVLIRGCCGVSRGPAHSAADTMKRPSALAHGFVQGKMEHHWFAHRFAPSPVYTCFILSIHPSPDPLFWMLRAHSGVRCTRQPAAVLCWLLLLWKAVSLCAQHWHKQHRWTQTSLVVIVTCLDVVQSFIHELNEIRLC